jgi:hypothetical protein
MSNYYAGSALVAGGAAQFALFSLDNPAGSGKIIAIKRFGIYGIASDAAASAQFIAWCTRTASVPSVGTLLVNQTGNTSQPASIAVARVSPTTTFAPGRIWTFAAGQNSVLGLGGWFNGECLSNFNDNADPFLLQPGEGIVAIINADSTGWQLSASATWSEQTQ